MSCWSVMRFQFLGSEKPSRPVSRERSAFWKDSWKVRPMAMASPTDFIWVLSSALEPGNFSNAKRGICSHDQLSDVLVWCTTLQRCDFDSDSSLTCAMLLCSTNPFAAQISLNAAQQSGEQDKKSRHFSPFCEP